MRFDVGSIPEYGASVSLTDANGKVLGTGTVFDVLNRVFRVKSKHGLAGTYHIRNGQKRDTNKTIVAKVVTAEEALRLDDEVERREEAEREEKERLRAQEAQARYDALPEAAKLARKLRWFCEVNREETIAQAPIEAIRAIVEWAIANKKEVD